ncbi:hypothetical protein ACFX2J_034679 [Malus domestica]
MPHRVKASQRSLLAFPLPRSPPTTVQRRRCSDSRGQQAMKLLCNSIYIYNGFPRAFPVGRRSRAESAEPGVIDGAAMPEEASEVKT